MTDPIFNGDFGGFVAGEEPNAVRHLYGTDYIKEDAYLELYYVYRGHGRLSLYAL